MGLSVASDEFSTLASSSDDVAELLEDYAAQIRSGERHATHAVIVLANMSKIDSFSMTTNYCGRAVQCLALADLAMHDLRGEILR